jgi:hypothetical protein
MATVSELFRFRIVRNIQAQSLDPNRAIDLTKLELAAPSQSTTFAAPVPLINPQTLQHWLVGVSRSLALQGDYVAPASVIALLPADWQTEVAAATWAQIQLQLAQSLAAAIPSQVTQGGAKPQVAPKSQVEFAEGLARLLRVQNLVTTLDADSGVAAAQKALQTADDVKALVAHKLVALPTSLFGRLENFVPLVRQPAFTDLYVVKDEWNRYEAGELSQIINVLPGETFDTRIKHFDKTETTQSSTTSTTTSQETDNSQTQSSSLSQASTKDTSLNIGVQGQVQVSAQYGPAQIQSSLGASLQSSQSDSETRAYTTSVETVQRSVKEVSQTVIEVQSTRTIVGDVQAEDHKLANTGTTTTVGLYRWLSEIHRMQLMKYPNRFVLEFELPEPGAWLRWAMQTTPLPMMDNPDPGPFRLAGATHDLSPLDLDPSTGADTIAQLATQWQIQGLPTPPPQQMVVSVVLDVDPSTQNEARFAVATDSTLSVPDGYYADSWSAEIFSTRTWSLPSYGSQMTVTVGGGANGQNGTGDMGTSPFGQGQLSGNVNGVNTGSIPVSVYTIALQGFTCVVNVTCKLMPETYRQWQQTAFDTIAGAYQSLKLAYQQELAAKAEQPGAVTSFVGSPELNLQRATAELRRLVIENLMNARFNGEDAIDRTTSTTGEPMVLLNTALSVAPVVQFFEQAFEWENLVYVCYPYYWAGRAQWPGNALSATADPVFDQFLNAGSARVVVPARPGFEYLVQFYLYTGVIWGGSQPPAPNDPDYLSVAQEIQSLQVGPTDGTPVGSSWEVSLPTTLIWAGSDPATLPANSAATLPAPTP